MKAKTHLLKVNSEEFKEIKDGTRKFVIQKNDTLFIVGDYMILELFIPCEKCGGRGKIHDGYEWGNCGYCKPPHGVSSGDCMIFKINYKLSCSDGLKTDYCVLQLEPIE